VNIDASEVRELASDLIHVPEEKLPELKRSLSRGALKIKNDMRDEAKSSGSYKHFHRSISYDLERDGLSAEIGPDKDKIQGALGNLLYFGSSNNAPVLNLFGPAERELPRFAKAVEDIAGDVL
jgi:hypothetical protein